jgi:hypothetical protein
MKIEITLTEEMLGTKAANPEVFATFIASKHPSGTPQRDELEQPENKEEAGTTIFHRSPDGKLGIYDYQVKGFFKDACGAINRFDKDNRNGLEKLAAYKTKIDGCIFVLPRFIPFVMVPGARVGICERPLRAETAQGPRVSVCRSETVPAGTKFVCELKILSGELKPYILEWLNYGTLRGLGQWRNSGKGRFTWAELV